MTPLTKEQSTILSAYTGILCGPFLAMHEYAERKFDRPVMTHEFGDSDFAAELKEKSRDDFMKLVYKGK